MLSYGEVQKNAFGNGAVPVTHHHLKRFQSSQSLDCEVQKQCQYLVCLFVLYK